MAREQAAPVCVRGGAGLGPFGEKEAERLTLPAERIQVTRAIEKDGPIKADPARHLDGP